MVVDARLGGQLEVASLVRQFRQEAAAAASERCVLLGPGLEQG